MRRLLTGLVVAAATLAPALALAGNQDVADQIAKGLSASGQLHDYKIGVKYQEGTAWVRGEVRDQEQMNTALRLVFQSPGVTRVVNELKVVAAPPKSAAEPAVASAERVPSSFEAAPAQPAAAQQPMVMAAPRPARPMPMRVAYRQDAMPTPAPGPMPPAEMPGPMVQGEMPGQGMAAGPPMPIAQPMPAYAPPGACPGPSPMQYDQPYLPNYSWPSYAAYPNYAALSYPRQYSPTAWPYIGPFYPYPQVPLGWRKVTLEWDDGWWFLDFKDK